MEQHLDEGGPDAWHAALVIFSHSFGKPKEEIEPAQHPLADLRSMSDAELAAARQELQTMLADSTGS